MGIIEISRARNARTTASDICAASKESMGLAPTELHLSRTKQDDSPSRPNSHSARHSPALSVPIRGGLFRKPANAQQKT